MWPTLATALQTRVFRAKSPKNTIFIEVHDEFVITVYDLAGAR